MKKFFALVVLSVVLFSSCIVCASSEATEPHTHLYQNPHEVTRYASISAYMHNQYKQIIATCECRATKDLTAPYDYVQEKHEWVVTSSGRDANGNIYYIAHCGKCWYHSTLYQ